MIESVILLDLLDLIWMHLLVFKNANNCSAIAEDVLKPLSVSLESISRHFMRHDNNADLRVAYLGMIVRLSQSGLEGLDLAGQNFVRPFALHVLVVCIFRQVDRYVQGRYAQANESPVMAKHRVQLKEAFETLHMHVLRIHPPYKMVSISILWSPSKKYKSLFCSTTMIVSCAVAAMRRIFIISLPNPLLPSKAECVLE